MLHIVRLNKHIERGAINVHQSLMMLQRASVGYQLCYWQSAFQYMQQLSKHAKILTLGVERTNGTCHWSDLWSILLELLLELEPMGSSSYTLRSPS